MNNQFQQARIKLTLWYVMILMIVSFIFSGVVYSSLNAELLRSARREQQKIVADQLKIVLPKPLPDPKDLQPELVDPPFNAQIQQEYLASRNQLLLYLFLANILVLGLSAFASYILAGKTLLPIEQMIDDQKKFVANASHELRTPLTTLKTAIEVTLKMGPIPYKQMKQILISNLDDVNSLETLTNNLLTIEKYSRTIDKQSFSDIRIDELVQGCVKRMTPKAEVHHITVSCKTTPITIHGNVDGLREMINNFLDNAIKYNKDNGSIEIKLLSQNGAACLLIKDTGIGIETSAIAHIFERFYRGDNSRSKTGIGGYGLGLSIAQQIIAQHQGKITVESVLGKGTTFTILLPIK